MSVCNEHSLCIKIEIVLCMRITISVRFWVDSVKGLNYKCRTIRGNFHQTWRLVAALTLRCIEDIAKYNTNKEGSPGDHFWRAAKQTGKFRKYLFLDIAYSFSADENVFYKKCL